MSIPRDVKKAIELIRSRPERDLRLKKLAASCGVAPRTLQKHLKQFVGKTPGQLRFEARMDRARRQLLRAKPNVSVAEIATCCGITHLGRFASLYNKRFGETPSATLRRRAVHHIHGSEPRILPSRLDRPIICVHTFDCATRAPGPSGSDLSETIRAALVRDRWLAVGPPDYARYHLRGSARRTGYALPITAILTSSETGQCIWADKWQGPIDELFAFEERTVARITATVQRALVKAETDRAAFKDHAQASSWELTMKAFPRAMRIDGASLTQALGLLEPAMELAPRDGLPVALAAWCRAQRGAHNFASHPATEKAHGLDLAARGAELTNGDPIAETLFGGTFAIAGDFGRAALHINQALALDGGSAWAWNRLGLLEIYRGNFRDATEAFQIARSLDPFNPLDFMCSVGFGSAHVDAGNYAEGARWFAHALAKHPAAIWINRFRAPTLLLAGQDDEAKSAFAQLITKHPGLSITAVREAIPYTQSHWDLLAEGLVDLGMPF